MLRYIQHYTESEIRRIMADENRSMQIEEIEAFIGITYVLGFLGAKACGQNPGVKI